MNWIQAWDGATLLWIQEHLRVTWLNGWMIFYTNLGEGGLLWICIALLFLCCPKTRRAGVLGLAALLLGYLCNDLILKMLITRPRPFRTIPELDILIPPPASFSFPSGHACASFAAAGCWRVSLRGKYAGIVQVVLLLMAALMAFSRLYVGVHYPSDVLVGSILGIAIGYLAGQFVGTAQTPG